MEGIVTVKVDDKVGICFVTHSVIDIVTVKFCTAQYML